MSKKINNKILAIILVVLTAIFLITNYLKDNQRSTHIDTNLIMIDTSIVSYISIYPKSGNKEKVIFTKQTYGWEVESNNIKSSLRKGSLANILSELAKMKIKRLVAKTEEKWEKYRNLTKLERAVGLKKLLNKVEDVEEHQKLSELIDTYLEAHDLVTKIGLEITKFTDKYNS